LKLDSNKLCTEYQLQHVLPVGRLNGFQSMLRTVQQYLQQLQQHTSASIATDSTTSTSSSTPIPSTTATAIISPSSSEEVAVLLSGGVDSSVALALLQQQGYKVRAYYLKIWLEDELAHLNTCPWEEDLAYAQQVCTQLQIPLETLSLQKEYWDYVVQYTLQEVQRGHTPNPDIMCNSRIKFGMFYEYIGK
jgi:asparagine synthetase B (glutamine-hydrolysing)